jgi:hypothetical protein
MPTYGFQLIGKDQETLGAESATLPDELSAWDWAFAVASGAEAGSEVRVLDEHGRIIFAVEAIPPEAKH